MTALDPTALARRLKVIESIAVIPRCPSTNLIARAIVTECVESGLPLPSAIIIAGEQSAGKGRGTRTWSSPAGRGIYATTLHTLPAGVLSLVPLSVAVVIASHLRARYGIDARIKWPNDVLAGGRKIAGILIEARTQGSDAYLIIGTGINVLPIGDDANPNATSIAEQVDESVGLHDATVAFVEHLDNALSRPLDRERVLARWRELTIHQPGDPIQCLAGDRMLTGTWNGIDAHGRAVLLNGSETTLISAGDLILV